MRYPVGYRRNPVATAQYGLWAFAAGRPRVALREADWLLARQRPDGRWLYHFDFTLDGVRLRAPWSSAMAQGQAMSLLERAYRLTGRRVYLAAAIRALRPLRISVADGGLRRCFEHDCRFTWLEEYPTSSGSYVLNGFMFTLVGLYDLASVAPGSGALTLYEDGRRTLRSALPLYDRDGLASYDLADRTRIASPGYQEIHVYLLRTLNQLSPDRIFLRYARRWAAGLPG